MAVAPQANDDGGRSEARSAGLRLRRRAVIVGAVIAAAACGAIASRRMMDWAPRDSQIIAVRPLTRPVRTPHEVCRSEEVRHMRPELDARGSAAKHTDHDARADDSYTTTEEHCVTVYEIEDEPQG